MWESCDFYFANESQTRQFASVIAPAFSPGELVLLAGQLGAGKTTFVRAVCRALAVPKETVITSPTFTLINHVEGGRLPIVHADLYRLADQDEETLLELGLLESAENALSFVEWGHSFDDLFDLHVSLMKFDFIDGRPDARHLRISRDIRKTPKWNEAIEKAVPLFGSRLVR